MKSHFYLFLSFLVTLFVSCTVKQGPSEQEIQDRIDAAVKQALAEKSITTTETASNDVKPSVTNYTNEESRTPSAVRQPRSSLVGKYTFCDDISQWTLDVNNDGSCQIHTNGDTYYGTWEYKDYDGGYYWLNMSDSYYVRINGDRLYQPNYIDIECNWLYQNSSSLKAKNPNKRVNLTRVN